MVCDHTLRGKTGNSFKLEEVKFVLSCGADHAWATALAQPYDDNRTASDRSISCRQGPCKWLPGTAPEDIGSSVQQRKRYER